MITLAGDIQFNPRLHLSTMNKFNRIGIDLLEFELSKVTVEGSLMV